MDEAAAGSDSVMGTCWTGSSSDRLMLGGGALLLCGGAQRVMGLSDGVVLMGCGVPVVLSTT